MLQIRKDTRLILIHPKVNQTVSESNVYLNKDNIFESKVENLLFSPGLSGRPRELHQIARYDE